jgi:RimJ/RimL family protein N-acetyltransferase
VLVYGGNGSLCPATLWNDRLKEWASERLGNLDFGPCIAIGVLHKADIVAVAIYNKYLHPNIEITFVTSSPRWQSPGAVRGILSYPFKQLNCNRITATTEATNQRARAFLCRLGFKQEGYHPDVFMTGDAVSYGLLRSDAARWLAEEAHVKSPTRDAA